MQPDPQAGQSAASTAEATGTPDAGAGSFNAANPFPFEDAFGGGGATLTAATVPDAPAPVAGDSAPAATQPSVSTPGTDPEPTDTAASDTPAPEPSKTDAAPVEGQDDTSSEPSRRQAARERDAETIKAQQAQIDEAVQRAIAARDEAEAAKAALAAREQADRQAAERLAGLRGDDTEYQRRLTISARMFDPNYKGEMLTNEQASELAQWTATRELQRPFEDQARQDAAKFVDEQIGGQRNKWAGEALRVADQIGLPRAELGKPENRDIGNLLLATDANAVARIRATEVNPLTEKLSQAEATIRSLEDKVVHSQRTPVIGGRSDGGLGAESGNGWDPSLSWDANLGRTPVANGAS